MKHFLLLGILLSSFCSCEEMISTAKKVNQFHNELQTKFPDESIGILQKLDTDGHVSYGVDETKDLSENLRPNTILIIFKNYASEEDEQFIAEELIGPIIIATKSVFGDEIKHGQLMLSDKKGLKGFALTSSKIIDFDIE